MNFNNTTIVFLNKIRYSTVCFSLAVALESLTIKCIWFSKPEIAQTHDLKGLVNTVSVLTLLSLP